LIKVTRRVNIAVESIGSVQTQTDTQTQQTAIGQDDLFEILLTQLTYQDPLKPLDNQEFIAQLAQFTSLEQSRQSNANLESMLTMQTSNQALGLIGNLVQVDISNGGAVGNVLTVTFQSGVPKLSVVLTDGNVLPNVSLSQISLVREGAADIQAADPEI